LFDFCLNLFRVIHNFINTQRKAKPEQPSGLRSALAAC
jgi:hypothetical protein